MSKDERELLVQTRGRVAKLLEELRNERQQLPASKLDAAAVAEGLQSLDAVIAALTKTAAATEEAMQRKGSSS